MADLRGRIVFVCCHALLVALLAWPSHAFAQVAASLSGTVRDESGGAVAGAVVVATAVDGGAVTVQTSVDGTFVMNALAPGRYSVIAQCDGFVPAVIPDLVLGAGSAKTVTLVLRIAGISEKVSVGAEQATPQAAPSSIDLAPAAVQSVAGAGENIYRVLQTLPGVAAVNDFGSELQSLLWTTSLTR